MPYVLLLACRIFIFACLKFCFALDVVVLPYKRASQSGVIPLSYHYNKPIITSDLEGLTEVVQDGKKMIVITESKNRNLNPHLEIEDKKGNAIISKCRSLNCILSSIQF